MTTDEKIDRLTVIVEGLAATVVAHDNQIEALITISEENARNWKSLEKQWQGGSRSIGSRQARRLLPQGRFAKLVGQRVGFLRHQHSGCG